MGKFQIISFILIIGSLNAWSQEAENDFLNLEFEFGIGYSQSVNNNYFNDSQGIKINGGVGINMAFRYHFNYNWSAGVHFLISTDEIID